MRVAKALTPALSQSERAQLRPHKIPDIGLPPLPLGEGLGVRDELRWTVPAAIGVPKAQDLAAKAIPANEASLVKESVNCGFLRASPAPIAKLSRPPGNRFKWPSCCSVSLPDAICCKGKGSKFCRGDTPTNYFALSIFSSIRE